MQPNQSPDIETSAEQINNQSRSMAEVPLSGLNRLNPVDLSQQ